jgi:hypothetical protein
LQDFSLGKDGVVMSGDQVRATIALLKKTVPDLQSVDLQGQVDSKITVNIMRYAGAAVQSPKEPSPV